MALNPNTAVQYATTIDEQFPGLCDHFVGAAYGFNHSGYASANAHWQQTPEEYRHTDTEAPIGSLVFFDTGKKWGHVAIVTGRGKNGPIVTTTHTQNGTPVEMPLSRMGMKYRGWTPAYFHGKVADLKAFNPQAGIAAVTDNTLYGNEQDTLNMRDLKDSYGIAAGVLKNNPDLKTAFKEIIDGKITDPALQLAKLKETNWFQTHTSQWMDVEKSRLEKDPRIWNALVAQRAEQVRLAFEQAGSQIDNPTAIKYAKQLMYGSQMVNGNFEIYDDKWLKNQIVDAIDFTQTKTVDGVQLTDLKGVAGEWATKLYDAAHQFGANSSMSDAGFKSWFSNTMDGLMRGTLDESQIDDDLRTQAMSRFPGLSNQIQRGLTVRQAADPYLRALADTWDMDINSLDLNDNAVQGILNQTDEQGNFKPMSIYETKLAARRDERFQYTDTAKQEYTGMAQQVLRDFGFLG